MMVAMCTHGFNVMCEIDDVHTKVISDEEREKWMERGDYLETDKNRGIAIANKHVTRANLSTGRMILHIKLFIF